MEEDLYDVTIDRPLGSAHPDYPSMIYPINYGYVEGVTGGDGEWQDAYVVGVDMPLDSFTGKKIAVIRRRDEAEEKWVIAPENIPYNKQQIEEMVYFQEQYFDSYVEMLNDEVWDAYDRSENKLGYNISRSMAKSLDNGVYHVVAVVYVRREDGSILTTQRSRNKTSPLKWEVTGGSILAGETPLEGAVRELKEETGIKKNICDLKEIYTCVDDLRHCIYHSYITEVAGDTRVHLQIGETMDYEFLTYDDFKELVYSERFADSERGRFIKYEAVIEKALKEGKSNGII